MMQAAAPGSRVTRALRASLEGWTVFSGGRLCATDAPEDNKPVWIQIAQEGTYKGHPAGPFELDRNDLLEVVRNFRAHPSFSPGADGFGASRIVPYDFHHASEMKPADVAVHGAPAQAWALDLDVRDGANGRAQLWALTEYLEPMRTYVREGRYQGTSVALWPDAVDPKTATKIGWYLSSIAFTNDPFIQGMLPIAAARGCCNDMLRARLNAQIAMAPDDPKACAPADDAAQSAVTEPQPEPLPPADETDEEKRKRLAIEIEIEDEKDEEEKAAVPVIGPAVNASRQKGGKVALSGSGRSELPRAGAHQETTMDELKKVLAARYNIATDSGEVEKRVLAELASGAGAQEALQTVMDLLGSADLAGATAQIQTFKDAIAKLEQVLPELKALGEVAIANEEAAAVADVEQAMASFHVPDVMKSALMAERVGHDEVTSDNFSETLPKRLAARDAFRQKYLAEKTPDVAVPAYLTQPLATPTPAPVVQSPLLRALTAEKLAPKPAAPVTAPPALGAGAVGLMAEIRKCAGRNITEQAIALVRSRPGGAALSHEDAHVAACALVREAQTAS